MDIKTETKPNVIEPITDKLKEYVIPRLPSWITTYNLTLISIFWSITILIAGYLSKFNIKWLYLVMVCVFFHWVTDSLDGALGKYRNTGAVKWGYFMDHTMDILLLDSVFIALIFALPKYNLIITLIILLIFQLFITAFLSLDKHGLDVSTCNIYFCVGPADLLVLLELGLFYVIYTNGKPNKYLFYLIFLFLIIINIQKIFQKQLKLNEEDQKAKL